MTRKTYCGNLLWQSSLTLLATDGGGEAVWQRGVREALDRRAGGQVEGEAHGGACGRGNGVFIAWLAAREA